MDNWEDDPQIRPHLERLARALDEFERTLDERDAVIEFIRREVEQFGGKIKQVFSDAVDAEFPQFPVELSLKIIREKWKRWKLSGNELTVWIR